MTRALAAALVLLVLTGGAPPRTRPVTVVDVVELHERIDLLEGRLRYLGDDLRRFGDGRDTLLFVDVVVPTSLPDSSAWLSVGYFDRAMVKVRRRGDGYAIDLMLIRVPK